MNVWENEDVLLKNNSTSPNIGGPFSEENVKSIVNQDKKVSPDDDSSCQHDVLKAVKSMLKPLKADNQSGNDKKPTKKLDKEQNTIEMLEEEDSEDYGEVEGVSVNLINSYLFCFLTCL